MGYRLRCVGVWVTRRRPRFARHAPPPRINAKIESHLRFVGQAEGVCLGERVLVLNDHGLGDTIQFFRYLPLMSAAGVDAAFACPPRLRRLLSSKANVRFADSAPEGHEFDAQIAISSLPYAFGARLDTIPAAVPYLAVEPPRREMW